MGSQASSNADFANVKTVMNMEFTKLNRQDAPAARATGHGSANNIVEEMAQAPTQTTIERIRQLLGYCASQEDNYLPLEQCMILK
jgi:hypothetical protein